jgi:hypothetical protein
MRLPIESWLPETQPLREVEVALREAITSYKAGAYRAALLFSYLGWGLALRGYPETLQQRRACIKQLPRDNEMQGNHFEKACSA